VTLDDDVERLRAKKKSYEESEREAGLEFGEECGTELAEYSALLRIPIAMDEVRREIEAQGLQDLIDPEHKMDADDRARFWEDRGFSGASESNDMWDKAFADWAAGLFQKPRRQL
jgi:hypothetical protein